ncbi:MAG: hypothetical protein KOO69_08415 [Victivallales bacterium]|nr:hypothetical protein [Victivallales bacterium]
MESIIKTIFFLLGGIVILALIIMFLPILIIAYIFMPKRFPQAWFNTFSQQSKKEDTQKKYYNNIPASEDIIDISADEIEK